MRSITGGTKLRDVIRSNTFFAMLATLLMTLVLLWAAPAWAQTAPDLTISKSGPTQVEPGQQFNYVLRVSRPAGAAPDTTNVTVTDNLPDGVTLVAADSSICSPPPLSPGDTVTCIIPPLEAGESETIRLTVKREAPGEITNRARAEDGTAPIAVSNPVTTRVVPNLVITKRDRPDPVTREGLLEYTVRVENRGNQQANNIRIRDDLPLDEVDFIRIERAGTECDVDEGRVLCLIDTLAPDEVFAFKVLVEPNEAGTIENIAEVFAGTTRVFVDRDTETTTVTGDGDNGGGGGGGGGGPGGGNGNDLPQGEQCSPVVRQGTEDPIGVISGTENSGLTFTNTFNQTLPLRIVYATSSEDGSLNITVTPQGGGDAVLEETIEGKKQGVLNVDTDSGKTYDIEILPEDQGFAVLFEIDRGTETCTEPESLDPADVASSSNDSNNDSNSSQNDVIDNTVPDDNLPETGGVPISTLAGLAALLLTGAAVVGAAARLRR